MDTRYIKENPIAAILMAIFFAVLFFWVKPALNGQRNDKTSSKEMSQWTVQDWKSDINDHMEGLDNELNDCNTLACISATVPSYANIGKYNSLLRYHANFSYEQEKEIKDYFDFKYTEITRKHTNRVENK